MKHQKFSSLLSFRSYDSFVSDNAYQRKQLWNEKWEWHTKGWANFDIF